MFASLPPPSSCARGEKEWRRILQKCSAKHVPAGFFQTYAPNLDATSASLIAEREDLRSQDPNDPEIAGLNTRISASIASTARKKWIETVHQADRRTNPSRFWRLLKGLSGKRASVSPNQPITFNNKTMSKPSSIAKHFCKQYANVKTFKQSKESRTIYKNLKKDNPLDRSYTPFSESDVVEAIKARKNSTAAGPNGLTILHLKHIGPLGICYLSHLFNLSVAAADIPAIWKCANVIPVPKPGKPADQGTSYRPISLLSPEIKVLERRNLGTFTAALSTSPSQHGFKKDHSTITAVLPLATHIARGLYREETCLQDGPPLCGSE